MKNVKEPRAFFMKPATPELLKKMGFKGKKPEDFPVFTKEQIRYVCESYLSCFAIAASGINEIFSETKAGKEELDKEAEPIVGNSFSEGIIMKLISSMGKEYEGRKLTSSCQKAFRKFEKFMNENDDKVIALIFLSAPYCTCSCFACLDSEEDDSAEVFSFGAPSLKG